jgi:cell division protein FtsI/penicillin-binding protein 2
MKLEFQKGSRSRFFAALVLGIMVIFVARLFYLQVIQHGFYVQQAYNEQVKPLAIPAQRGMIYAMDGDSPVPLVMNETVYTMIADPQTVSNASKVESTVREIAGGNARPNIPDMLAKTDTRYQVLATKLTRQQAEMIKAKKLTGIRLVEMSQRVYPEGSLAAQTLGFVNAEGKGQYGVEEKLDDRLKGKDGLLKSVTDISNVPLTIGNNNVYKPAKNGDNVVLTIDRNIQAYTEKALTQGLKNSKAPNGSVIVMDPQTGHVLAMANQPTYSPAEFNKVQDAAAFNNAVVTVPYEPGSDIKTLTVATGLDKNVIKPDSTYNNTDYIKVEDRTISNATKGQTGNITIQHALNYSLNTGMVTVAERLGDGQQITRQARDTMYTYYHDRFGFGELTGIEVAGEQPGIVIPPTSSEGNAVRYSNMSFGQGMDLTMVQVASAFSSIINGGTYYQPTVVAGMMNDDLSKFRPQTPKVVRQGVIAPETSNTIREMVHQARAVFYAAKDKPGYYVGGKTGTSQTLENGHYVDNQTVGTYLGFGGTDAPRYVIMVQVSGKGMNLAGNTDAMPIFTDISNWMIDYLKLQPKG